MISRCNALKPKPNLQNFIFPLQEEILKCLSIREICIVAPVSRRLNNASYLAIASKLGYKASDVEDAREEVNFFLTEIRKARTFLLNRGIPVVRNRNNGILVEQTFLSWSRLSKVKLLHIYETGISLRCGIFTILISRYLRGNVVDNKPLTLTQCRQLQAQFMWAVVGGFTDMVQLYLSLGASLEIPGRVCYLHHTKKYTPLAAAAKYNLESCVELLLNANADPDSALSFNNKTALHCAAEKGNVAISVLLLQHGGNVDCECDKGNTPLIMASRKGNVKLVEELLLGRPSLSHQNRKGNAALHYARTSQIARLLLNAKASINAVNKEGLTAAQLAMQHGRNGVARTLQKG